MTQCARSTWLFPTLDSKHAHDCNDKKWDEPAREAIITSTPTVYL